MNKSKCLCILAFSLLIPSSLPLQIPCGKSFFPCSSSSLDPAKITSAAPLRRAHGVAIHSSPPLEVYPYKVNDEMLRSAAKEAHEETEVLYNESGAKPLDLSDTYSFFMHKKAHFVKSIHWLLPWHSSVISTRSMNRQNRLLQWGHKWKCLC